MAWPKHGTRKIVVEGQAFVWHYDAHCAFCSDDVLTAGKPEAPFVLFIDPFPWGLEVRPANVAAAIRWALANGWSAERGPTRPVAMNVESDAFQWLEAHQRHIGCVKSSPDDP